MALVTQNFDSWLSQKLQDLKTDEGVFGSYIKGILEGDETEDEKSEALEGILAGITEDNIRIHVNEILEAWEKWRPVDNESLDCVPKEDVDVRLARMLESQSLPTTSHKSNYTEEEKRIRDAILAQYSQMSDQEEDEDEGDEDGVGSGPSADSGLERNTNAASIIQAEKEKRERAKLESQKKKEKDKEDREKQKQLKEEKKEKRKTVKGERRR